MSIWLRKLLVGAVVEDVGPRHVALRTPDGKRYYYSAGGYEYEMDLEEVRERPKHPA